MLAAVRNRVAKLPNCARMRLSCSPKVPSFLPLAMPYAFRQFAASPASGNAPGWELAPVQAEPIVASAGTDAANPTTRLTSSPRIAAPAARRGARLGCVELMVLLTLLSQVA